MADSEFILFINHEILHPRPLSSAPEHAAERSGFYHHMLDAVPWIEYHQCKTPWIAVCLAITDIVKTVEDAEAVLPRVLLLVNNMSITRKVACNHLRKVMFKDADDDMRKCVAQIAEFSEQDEHDHIEGRKIVKVRRKSSIVVNTDRTLAAAETRICDLELSVERILGRLTELTNEEAPVLKKRKRSRVAVIDGVSIQKIPSVRYLTHEEKQQQLKTAEDRLREHGVLVTNAHLRLLGLGAATVNHCRTI